MTAALRTATSFAFLRALSFTNSAVFCGLLILWVAGSPEPVTFAFGLTHGLMWITLSVLCLLAIRRRTIPFWLAVLVAVIGGLGPFAGSAGFVWVKRRSALHPGSTHPDAAH